MGATTINRSWTGTAVNDTSVVVATGYLYGKVAGAAATVVKLTRTLLLVSLAFVLGTAHAARRNGGSGSSPRVVLRKRFLASCWGSPRWRCSTAPGCFRPIWPMPSRKSPASSTI